MSCDPTGSVEALRLKALRDLRILDSANDEAFDNLVQLAAAVLDVPISLVSFVDEGRQWFKAKHGLSASQTPRSDSFCAHAIQEEAVMVIEDATEDPRFCDNALVTGVPFIRFYAGAPIYSPDGYALGTLCVIDTKPRPVSEEKIHALRTLSNQVSKLIELRHSNQQLQESKQQIDRHNENLTRLMRMIAHDLRNPFNGLMNLTELLRMDISTMNEDDVSKILDLLNESTHHAFNLLENLLEWSSCEAHMMDYTPEAVYFKGIYKQVLTVIGPSIELKSQKLRFDAPEDLLLRVDQRMITSVIRNLISNASKFTKHGGEIIVKADVQGNHALITVIDDGVGMELEQIKGILEKQRIQSTMGTKGEKGFGIGLELIHSFLSQHGAELQIASAPDEGTRASFTLSIA